MSVYYLPWWALLACLVASALAAYLFLRRIPRAGDSPWVLFPLTAALAPVVLVGSMVAAITLSTLLSAFVEERTGPPAGASEPRALTTERTRSPTTTVERTHPATTEEQTTTAATATSTATATATATASP